jgi:hypothetical protein
MIENLTKDFSYEYYQLIDDIEHYIQEIEEEKSIPLSARSGMAYCRIMDNESYAVFDMITFIGNDIVRYKKYVKNQFITKSKFSI